MSIHAQAYVPSTETTNLRAGSGQTLSCPTRICTTGHQQVQIYLPQVCVCVCVIGTLWLVSRRNTFTPASTNLPQVCVSVCGFGSLLLISRRITFTASGFLHKYSTILPQVTQGGTQNGFRTTFELATVYIGTVRPIPYNDNDDLSGRWRWLMKETNKITRGEIIKLHVNDSESDSTQFKKKTISFARTMN